MNQHDDTAAFITESIALITTLCADPWTGRSRRIVEEAATPVLDGKGMSFSESLSGDLTSVFWESPETDEVAVLTIFDGIVTGITPTVGDDYDSRDASGGAKVALWTRRDGPHVLVFGRTPEEKLHTRGSVQVALSRIPIDATSTSSSAADRDATSSFDRPADPDSFVAESLSLITELTSGPWPDKSYRADRPGNRTGSRTHHQASLG